MNYLPFARAMTLLLILPLFSACGTSTKSTAQPSGFCDNLPHPVHYYGDIGPPEFKAWTEQTIAKWNALCRAS
jgi:hypothetical protein